MITQTETSFESSILRQCAEHFGAAIASGSSLGAHIKFASRQRGRELVFTDFGGLKAFVREEKTFQLRSM